MVHTFGVGKLNMLKNAAEFIKLYLQKEKVCSYMFERKKYVTHKNLE
jgi:hypothetical protein